MLNRRVIWLARVYLVVHFLRRNVKIARFLLNILILIGVVSLFFGVQTWVVSFRIILSILQMAFYLAFAILQFVAIFWWMSKTRMVEVLPGEGTELTLDDYKGQPTLRAAMMQWTRLLTERKDYRQMGGRMISGIMLTGGPGLGKTYLARCLAASAGVAFLGTEGSSFRAMFFGVDSLKVSALFRKARRLAWQYGGCIIYIDELDSIGASRSGMGGGQTSNLGMMGGMAGGGALTRLLYEMDGLGEITAWQRAVDRASRKLGHGPLDFGSTLVMGATNIPHVIDSALKRPGRFDRIIEVSPPDRAGREEILRYYLAAIQHCLTEADIEDLTEGTSWATPAAIHSAITKDAVRIALFDKRALITVDDVVAAFQEQAIGIANPISDLTEDQRWQIAVHEAGHAIAQYYLRNDKSRIVRLSIIRRQGALGYMLPASRYDVYAMPLKDIVRDIMVSLAGHVATELILGEPWTGASQDFAMVRVRLEVLSHLAAFGDLPGYGEDKQERVGKYFGKLVENTRELLFLHRNELETLARELVARQDMSGDEVEQVIIQVGGRDEQAKAAVSIPVSFPAGGADRSVSVETS